MLTTLDTLLCSVDYGSAEILWDFCLENNIIAPSLLWQDSYISRLASSGSSFYYFSYHNRNTESYPSYG